MLRQRAIFAVRDGPQTRRASWPCSLRLRATQLPLVAPRKARPPPARRGDVSASVLSVSHAALASIRAAGRWSSEIYQIYCRLSRQSAAGVATTIGSTPFEDLERGVSFVDEELMLTVDEMPYLAASDFVERDLLEDAWDGEDEA